MKQHTIKEDINGEAYEELPPETIYTRILKYMFKAYIAWSVIADIIILSGIIYLIFF